jgi:hypothetical protein
MSDKEEKLYTEHCDSCGVLFGISKDRERAWRNSHKAFFCPNGCAVSFRDETPDQKELKSLRIEVKELKDKLSVALATIKLHAELQVLHPPSTEDVPEQTT